MAIDWGDLSCRLGAEVVGAAMAARDAGPRHAPRSVEITDIHIRDMLVLWPSITVHHTDPALPPTVVEGARWGDRQASEITALGGPGGTRWETVFAQYHRTLTAACDSAAAVLRVPVTLAGTAQPDDPVVAPIDTLVPAEGPLDYQHLCDVLAGSPELDHELAERLSPEATRAIDASDVPIAVAALSSPWMSVRRHASIVLLSVHL